jgi:hypothetical protein
MQLRISEGPYAALGVSETAAVDEVRAAFLALTKQFHPARFGRMSTELQRLSNEVFLGIKTAHDQLMKQLGGALRGGVAQSGSMPAIRAEGSSRTPTGANPPVARPSSGPLARGTERGSAPVISRTTTPLQPVTDDRTTVASAKRERTLGGGNPVGGTRPATPHSGMPHARPATPQPGRPATPQPGRPTTPQPARTTPPLGMPIQRPTGQRPSTPPLNRPGAPPARPATPPAPTTYNADTIRHSGVPAFDERAAHREAMISLNEQEWGKARQTLQALAQHRPQSKNYGALLAYARGREAQKLGRVADAALEFQRALELEPDLGMAKQALAEVQRRR